ncbi:translation initiation factor IF-2 [Virgibacillus natechei]|uniref:Translation initiation factor IF-2 n=1 Tax=Virgibacillus natechei TaxID=1216297 RepID=A0ABS4IB15_9BACI|nr:translation initiation factor IF-2 [Virgibacillus natechei]MBP1968063.1 translation initiation factor IF-2 [Virgibacillus natechei]UZD14656.1 translation initiation factor IF-2 [Virgibacillus natechei]
MSKIRVYEYAKQKNTTSKDVINHLNNLNIEVSNHMSTITSETASKLDEKYNAASSSNVKNQQPKKENASNKAGQSMNKKENPGKSNNSSKPQSGQQRKPQQNRHNNQNQKGRRGRGNKPVGKKQPPVRNIPERITYSDTLAVSDLASKLNMQTAEIIKKLMSLGVMATKNQDLDDDTVELICTDLNIEVEKEIILEDTDFDKYRVEEKDADLIERPSVVTIMGHVDHGKTTLLDSIRHTKVTAGEAGGITQHIGAYQVEDQGKKVTFLDTPGHAAFTSMRSRGAQVTDIAILVVAADDGVMPQTVEAISHAKAAEVPIIVAVNKMDKEGANPDRVMQELTEYELIPEAWGGDTIFVNVTATKAEGIDDILEMILLVSEVEELKANPNTNATGTVIDAQLDKGRGSVATLLVQNGTLQVGDMVVVGNTYGRVRTMVNDVGQRVSEAGPSTPVEVTGLNQVPQAGDQFMVFVDEKKARHIGEAREQKYIVENRSQQSKISLDDLFEQIKQGEMKEINIIIKADVQGSAEALANSLQKIEVEGVNIKIIHTGVGAITESDIILASASNAIVIGFSVRPDVNAKKAADSEKVDVRLHRVIYTAIEEVESAMKGLLDPEYEEKVIGQVEVREIYKVSKIGTIAGSYVTDGKITRNAGIRVIRDGVVQFEGEIDALKRFKDDVKEVAKNYECGITVKNFNDIKEGDVIEAFIMEEIERK